MQKSFTYNDVRFDAAVLKNAVNEFGQIVGKNARGLATVRDSGGANWSYDELDEFYSAYRRSSTYAHLLQLCDPNEFQFSMDGSQVTLRVKLPSRASIEKIFGFFDDAEAESKVPPSISKPEVSIFIGHGRSEQWRKLADHLRDQHDYTINAYETGARAGHTIRDILDDLASQSSMAILVFTGEDEQVDGQLRARQNVVHEAGLFQGKLGFSKAIVLLEEGVEGLSNLDGVQYIPFSKGNIRETFGDVLATIRRES
jgi:hypothetical protein